MSTPKQDADKQTIKDEAEAEARESTRAAADDAEWKTAKFTTEEFRVHDDDLLKRPRTLWQRFKSWIYD